MELVWFECSSSHDQVEQDSCLHCFSEQYQSHLPMSLVCAIIEAEEDWEHYQCCAGSTSGGSTWHYSLCVTRGELAQGLGWECGPWVCVWPWVVTG